MSNTVVRRIKKYNYTAGWGIKEHQHSHYQLYFVTDGMASISVDGVSYIISKGMYALFHPKVPHDMRRITRGDTKMYDVEFEVHKSKVKKGLAAIPVCDSYHNERFESILIQMRDEWRDGWEFGRDMCNTLMEELIYHLLKEKKPVYIQEDGLDFSKFAHIGFNKELTGATKNVVDYIAEHYHEDISLEKIAGDLNYTKNHLCKIFRFETNNTIMNYLSYYRISKSIDLIANTNDKLSDICLQVGFKDIHHFTRVFKKTTGLTPGEFQRREKQGLDVMTQGPYYWQ